MRRSNSKLPANQFPDFHRDSSFSFRWLGVGGLEFRWQSTTLLVDPFLSRPSLFQLLLPLKPNKRLLREKITKADAILITHPHYDHILDVPEIVSFTQAEVYGSPYAMKILKAQNVKVDLCHSIQPGEELEIGPLLIKTLPGGHIALPYFFFKEPIPEPTPPLWVWDYQMDACFSYEIRTRELSVLVWHNILADDAPTAQALFFHPDIEAAELQKLIHRVQPQFAIPIHWDNFFQPLRENLSPFIKPSHKIFPLLERTDLQIIAQEIRELSPSTQVILPKPLSLVTFS